MRLVNHLTIFFYLLIIKQLSAQLALPQHIFNNEASAINLWLNKEVRSDVDINGQYFCRAFQNQRILKITNDSSFVESQLYAFIEDTTGQNTLLEKGAASVYQVYTFDYNEEGKAIEISYHQILYSYVQEEPFLQYDAKQYELSYHGHTGLLQSVSVRNKEPLIIYRIDSTATKNESSEPILTAEQLVLAWKKKDWELFPIIERKNYFHDMQLRLRNVVQYQLEEATGELAIKKSYAFKYIDCEEEVTNISLFNFTKNGAEVHKTIQKFRPVYHKKGYLDKIEPVDGSNPKTKTTATYNFRYSQNGLVNKMDKIENNTRENINVTHNNHSTSITQQDSFTEEYTLDQNGIVTQLKIVEQDIPKGNRWFYKYEKIKP